MPTNGNESADYLSQIDRDVLDDLVINLSMSKGTQIIFAIAPESGPKHPVVETLKSVLSSEEFQFKNFFYSEDSLINFLYSLDAVNQGVAVSPPSPKATETITVDRKPIVVMAYGIEQLPKHRIVRELKQLNLGRDELFRRNLVLIFWLNKREFLEEFRHRAPDFWDWRGQVVTFQARPPLDPLLYPYLESLIAQNSYLKISGVMQVQRQVDIFLDRVYISLMAERQQQVRESLDRRSQELEFVISRRSGRKGDRTAMELETLEPSIPDFIPTATSSKTVIQKVDLAQAVQDSQYSVILGDPGAGKTTLLHYLTLHFAKAVRDEKETVIAGEPEQELGKTRLPVLFRIADYAERLVKQPDLSLLEFLREFYQQWEAERGITELLCEKMGYGQCLILLDGLDEVFDQANRQVIVQRIEEFVTDYSDNKFVITSRIAGYGEVKLSDRFTHFTIAEMTSEQVERFLDRWCLAIERAQKLDASEEFCQREAAKEARELLEAIRENEGVKRLTGNPLLLTILALIHRNGSRLPNRRVELYALAVKTLIEDWQLSKNLPDAAKFVLKESEVVELLAPLAYWMHEEKPSGLITQAEAEEKLGEKLAELHDEVGPGEIVSQAVEQFLRRVRETTGLFVERGTGVYSFMHLTFEEYFAARYIADNDVSDILEIIRQHLHEARWQEPILLALGYLGIHNPKQLNKLLERLFRSLEDYQPTLGQGEIKLKNSSSSQPILVWPVLGDDSSIGEQESGAVWPDLLFAGRIISEIEVNSRFRSRILDKLVLTYVGLDEEFENAALKQLLKQLRQIKVFNQKGEVITRLQEVAADSNLAEETRIKAQLAILYIACHEPGTELMGAVITVVKQLHPVWFCGIKDLMAELGAEMTPALETMQQSQRGDGESQLALTFVTAMSYLRTDNYDKAIALFNEINEREDNSIGAFVYWALALCYVGKEEYNNAHDCYCQSKMAEYSEKNALFLFWTDWGNCNRLHAQYEQALECFQKGMTIVKEIKSSKYEANILYNIARVYQAWGKYAEAIAHHQHSRELYQELGKQQDVANQWSWLADCYRKWGKYEQAVECAQQDLAIRQQLDDQANIAGGYFELGYIYQAWRKYEQAIAHHQHSRELYQELDKQEDVANQWFWLAICYRVWGKYEQAVECAQQVLAIRQQLDDQANIADGYLELGGIYQAWGKYEQAIAHYQQSRELYQELGKQEDVANHWFWLASCYREWGKYEQAVECTQQDLAIRQQLDDQANIADGYFQLGRIYQAWGKYEQAIAHYQESRGLYQQLGKQENIAWLWYWLAYCYREWGKYEQVVECAQQDLAIRQQLDDQANIADAHFQLGYIYQAWGKYEQAIAHYQQSRELYQQLGKQQDVAGLWYWLADCYREWGKYEPAVECAQQDLAIRQQLDDQANIARGYLELGRIYQAWGKYEQAIAHYQQSRELYQQLGKQQDVAGLWYWLADCYREWGKYEPAVECAQQDLAIRQQLDDQANIARGYYQLGRIYQDWGNHKQAIEYYQQSRNLYEKITRNISIARCLRAIANNQRLLAKNTPDRTAALNLLTQAEQNLHQAIQINTAGDYKQNLAYDYTTLGLLYSERLKQLPTDDPSLAEQIAQFEYYYHTGLTYLAELGQTINRAEESLDQSRAYLEVYPLENLDQAEAIIRASLQIFQDYNRHQLQAAACKLLGEIYLRRTQQNQPDAAATAHQFLTQSLQLYQELDLTEKAAEVEELIAVPGRVST